MAGAGTRELEPARTSHITHVSVADPHGELISGCELAVVARRVSPPMLAQMVVSKNGGDDASGLTRWTT